ncbi:hypothetical protein [Providencia stuartii]|uniref:hypothetical protein n=1 Tax=Providencia stuartii TaxID=588 RepID=UPI0034DEE8EB
MGSVSRNFCSSCSKLRITADARLISCLYHHESIDLALALRGEINEGGAEEARVSD